MAKYNVQNIWRHCKSTVLGAALLVALYALVYPLKLATFDQVSPLFILVVPFLLFGKKPKRIDGE